MSLKQWGSRKVVERLVITGTLRLLTPTHLGSGEAADITDMTLTRDEVTGRPLLTGTTIAGALRNYLRERLYGYDGLLPKESPIESPLTLLFGGARGDEEGNQSQLIVDDALGRSSGVEIRDGVAIDPKTGTAEEHKKYDIELLAAGTTFPLRFELLIQAGKEEELKEALAIALQGLERGEIRLGARKRRGLGRCQVEMWRVVSYDLTTPEGLIAWLKEMEEPAQEGQKIAELLGVEAEEDHRERFTLEATFRLRSPLLIRSAEKGAELGADFAQLHSHRDGEEVPVLPGTSVAGVLRHRALRILNTLHDGAGETLVRQLFGGEEKTNEGTKLTASRLIVEETVIQEAAMLIQPRIRIDRFTGGAYPGALFGEAPIVGNPQVQLKLELRNPQKWEIGLLLLLLKDLWTGDLPIGGGRSIGRGQLQGVEVSMTCRGQDPSWRGTIRQDEKGLHLEGCPQERLESYLNDLHQEVKREREKGE